jgi:hypothetical protein
MLQPVKNIDEYKRIKQNLRDRFESERTGEQHLFIEQTKLLQPLIKPLISTQEQAVKAIQENAKQPAAIMGETVRPALTMPEAPLSQPETRPGLLSPAEVPEEPIRIDLDSGFNETDIRNLHDMGFELPSEVFKKIKQIEKTIAKIKTENRRIGQKLGKGSDATTEEKKVFESWKKTLENYRQKIQGLESAKQFVGRGAALPPAHLMQAGNEVALGAPLSLRSPLEVRPRVPEVSHTQQSMPDVIFYASVEDLCSTLTQLDAAKQAGNTGLDNRIISVLDELLRTGAVSKNEYDSLYKIIFL